MNTSRAACFLSVLLPLGLLGASEPPSEDRGVIDAMRGELGRGATALRLPNAPPPYYVGYWVVDSSEHSVEATLGALVSDESASNRFVKVELRAGSRESDNSNFAGGATDGDFLRDAAVLSPQPAPRDDGPLPLVPLARALWLATDAAYKSAVETLERKRASNQSDIAIRASVPSFSTEPVHSVFVQEPRAVTKPVDPVALAKQVSAVFRNYPEVQESSVHLLETRTRRRFVSSEGSIAVEPGRFSGLEITCEGQAEDGMPLERSTFLAAPEGSDVDLAAAVAEAHRVAHELSKLERAEVAEDYAGPVLFEGKAAAQLVYELLGDSLSGTPAPVGNDALESSLARKLGRRILPRDLTVVDDPTLGAYEGVPLLGHYGVDDEGVPGERVTLVDDGRLTSFLMSRTPREGFLRSNGHGRSGLVGFARGHVGNLIVSSKAGLTKPALRARLLAAVREEGGRFGLVITELESRTSATSGEVMPGVQVAMQLSLDGKETWIRGATAAPMNVRDLRSILASGRAASVYGFLVESDGGTDTGVSVVAPSLLFEDVEIHGPQTPNKRPPVVPRPAFAPLSSPAK